MDFIVARLGKVLVPPADTAEILGRHDTDDFFRDFAKLSDD